MEVNDLRDLESIFAQVGDHSISGANCLLAMKVPFCFPSSSGTAPLNGG